MDFKMFKKIINTIKKHRKWQDKCTDFFEKNFCTDTWAFVTIGNDLIELLMEILKNEFNDKDGWIGWWLYEDVEKIIYYPDETMENIEKIEDFYNFLIKNKKS